MTGGALLFWLATALLAWVYAGYPLAAAIAGRIRPFVVEPRLPPPALVTVGISAYNEASQFESRVADVFAQRLDAALELVIASDGSTDESEKLLDRIAAAEPRVRVLHLPRGGKTAALNAIFEAARGEIVVLTDAETRFAPGCLEAIVTAFADPRVGCATGLLHWIDGDRTPTARNEGFYWRYEQLVRRLESRAGWLTAATGALLAVRREVYRPVPGHADMDHLLPLYARDLGLVVLAVPAGMASDRGIAGLREQLRNRTRTATRGIRANLLMSRRLTPWRRPAAFLASWSHKILRWATPWLALAALAGAALAVSAGEAAYLLPLGLAALGLGLAWVGYALRSRGLYARLPSFALAVLVVNVAFLNGWLNLARGQRIAVWHRTDWRAVADEVDPPAG